MDYVTPKEVINDAIELSRKKADLPVRDLLIRGVLAGALLGCATSVAFMALSQGVLPLVAAMIFPAGFVMLVLLGQELARQFCFAATGRDVWKSPGRGNAAQLGVGLCGQPARELGLRAAVLFVADQLRHV